MNQMTLQEMTDKVRRFCEERDWDQYHNPKDLAIGLSTESNELLDIFRFKDEEQMQEIFSDEKKRTHVKEECADILFFLLRFAQMNDLDLGECLDEKIVKNAEKYPVESSKGRKEKYDEL